jgi:hypothetical protein
MFLVIEHEVGFGHLRKATAASGSLISSGNLKTSEYCGVMKCIPTKTITVRDYDKLWFTSEIRKEIRLRDRLRKKNSNLGGKVIF